MGTLFWIFIAICALALSVDVVDWLCDKVADGFNQEESNEASKF